MQKGHISSWRCDPSYFVALQMVRHAWASISDGLVFPRPLLIGGA